jgi:hypothetical protein
MSARVSRGCPHAGKRRRRIAAAGVTGVVVCREGRELELPKFSSNHFPPATSMVKMDFFMRARFLSMFSVFSLVALGGCQSDGPGGGRGTGGAPMTASGELAIPNPKPMDAQATLFDGGVQVEVMLAKSDVAW